MFTRIKMVRTARLFVPNCYSVKLLQQKECDLPVGILLFSPLVKLNLP